MCEQCLVNAETVLNDILPGFTLMKAQTGIETWPVGWYGLVQSNDPDFVFPGPLRRDPSSGLSEPELDAFDFDGSEYTEYTAAVQGLKQPLSRMPALLGYELIKACLKAGYSVEHDGTEVAYWLMNHLATAVAVRNA